jgi:plastocyanin
MGLVKKVVAVFALALLVAMLSGCVVQSSPSKPAGNTVTMGVNNFSSGDAITIKVGDTITFLTESGGTTHILVIGTQGSAETEAGAPSFNGSTGIQVDPGKSWVSPPWTTPGTYHVTCVVHPTTMNMTVTVTG